MMRFILAAALAAVFQFAAAAPVCTPAAPADVRIGVTFNPDGSAAGAWAYWWCVVDAKVTYEWRAAPSSSFSPAVLAQIRAYAVGANADFINTPTTVAADDPSLALMRASITAAAAVDVGKPVVPVDVWRTPASGTYTLYTATSGRLSGVVSGRKASAGALCDCMAPVFSGSSTYCPLKGAVASEVTLCKKAPS